MGSRRISPRPQLVATNGCRDHRFLERGNHLRDRRLVPRVAVIVMTLSMSSSQPGTRSQPDPPSSRHRNSPLTLSSPWSPNRSSSLPYKDVILATTAVDFVRSIGPADQVICTTGKHGAGTRQHDHVPVRRSTDDAPCQRWSPRLPQLRDFRTRGASVTSIVAGASEANPSTNETVATAKTPNFLRELRPCSSN